MLRAGVLPMSGRFNPRAHAGRDFSCPIAMIADVSFNPRAHAGRDAPIPLWYCPPIEVSIHAPTQGATACPYPLRQDLQCFNPRAHAGRDGLNFFVVLLV